MSLYNERCVYKFVLYDQNVSVVKIYNCVFTFVFSTIFYVLNCKNMSLILSFYICNYQNL